MFRIFVLSSIDEIDTLNRDEKIIHFSFRPTAKDIMNVYSKCPDLIAIQMPKSYSENMSSSIKLFLEMNKIKLIKGNLWGHRKDINPYFNLKEVVDQIIKMKENNMDKDYIVSNIYKKIGLSYEFCLFLYDSV